MWNLFFQVEGGTQDDIWAYEGRGTRGNGEDCITMSSMIHTSSQILLWLWNQEVSDWRVMWHVCGDVRSMWGLVRKPGGEGPLRKSRRKRGDNIKVDNKEISGECVCLCVCGLMWLTVGANGGMLWKGRWNSWKIINLLRRTLICGVS